MYGKHHNVHQYSKWIREGQLRKCLRVNWIEVEMGGICAEGFVGDEGWVEYVQKDLWEMKVKRERQNI